MSLPARGSRAGSSVNCAYDLACAAATAASLIELALGRVAAARWGARRGAVARQRGGVRRRCAGGGRPRYVRRMPPVSRPAGAAAVAGARSAGRGGRRRLRRSGSGQPPELAGADGESARPLHLRVAPHSLQPAHAGCGRPQSRSLPPRQRGQCGAILTTPAQTGPARDTGATTSLRLREFAFGEQDFQALRSARQVAHRYPSLGAEARAGLWPADAAPARAAVAYLRRVSRAAEWRRAGARRALQRHHDQSRPRSFASRITSSICASTSWRRASRIARGSDGCVSGRPVAPRARSLTRSP